MLGYIRKHSLLWPGDRVGVAVSGGADSVGLLRLMLELRDELGIVLSVVHLNHQLRGAESELDQGFVRDLASKHDLEFTTKSRDVKAYASERKLSLEAAARELRYEFFRGVLRSGVNRIATAHTLDDQAETVLLKLARGAGTRGLAGVAPKIVVNQGELGTEKSALREAVPPGENALSIIRPLLRTRRATLREYLAQIGQAWREDASNQDLRHMRNRIRHEILPELEQNVNPSFCEVLGGTAEIARGEEEHWAAEISRLLPELWHLDDDQSGTLLRDRLTSFSLATQRRLVRASAESLGLSLEFLHVEELLNIDRKGGRIVLPGTWTATLNKNELRFQNSENPVPDYQYQLPVPGRIKIAEAAVEIEVLLASGTNGAGEYGSQHLFPAQLARSGLVVRNWRRGERFWPAHTKEPKKIKELLQDRHITGAKKRLWPVVASGGEVIWMRGFGVRRDFQTNGGESILIRETGSGQI